MTQTKSNAGYLPAAAGRYAAVLYELAYPKKAIEETREILKTNPVLTETLMNPTIPEREKRNVIERIFPQEMKNFLKTVCKNQRMNLISDIFAAFDRYCDRQDGILNAQILCVQPPAKEQQDKIETFLKKKYGAAQVRFTITRAPELLGGFILRAGGEEYDRSLKGRLKRLEEKLTWR